MRITVNTEIAEYPLLSRGKVRDIYDLGADTLLIVTTDRMSAFDVVMNEPIPFKGVVLNKITIFWMEKFRDIVANHLLAVDTGDFPAGLRKYSDMLEGRAVVVRKAKPLPVECIVRGYITGSGWKDYRKTGRVCGHVLPQDMKESEKLPEPLFTPSTKAEVGVHDENITLAQAEGIIGSGLLGEVERLSREIYSQGSAYALEKGIIMADTKFEFGLIDDKLYLIDEVLTPDSSRFWPTDGYAPGRGQPSFDKQYLRDWLQNSGWDKRPPAPALPEDVIGITREKYFEAYRILTGKEPV